MTYIHIPLSASYQARRQITSLVSEYKVHGTMNVLAVATLIPSQKIAVRETYCYKDCCWSNQKHKMGCSGWKQHILFDQQPSQSPQTTLGVMTENGNGNETITTVDVTADVPLEETEEAIITLATAGMTVNAL